MFKELLGNSFLFGKGDDLWKAKRKACSHAFYKDRLTKMVGVLKHKIIDAFTKWQAEIDDAYDGTTVIDINYEFERIFSRNIITIAFGEDVSDERFEVQIPTNEAQTEFETKQVSIREGLHVTLEILVRNSVDRFSDSKNFGIIGTGKKL
jgi:hypothetical protein